jgi:hypothetical protein
MPQQIFGVFHAASIAIDLRSLTAFEASVEYTQRLGESHGMRQIGDAAFETDLGSLGRYVKGAIEVIDDDRKNYAFSNVFDVAAHASAYEKVVVAKNLGYVIETLRAEGDSGWFVAAHDEFALVMDGLVEIDLVKLDDPLSAVPPDAEGSHRLAGEPAGRKMGRLKLWRGHQALLPAGAAYRFRAAAAGVIVLQTMLGPCSVQKWREICFT